MRNYLTYKYSFENDRIKEKKKMKEMKEKPIGIKIDWDSDKIIIFLIVDDFLYVIFLNMLSLFDGWFLFSFYI